LEKTDPDETNVSTAMEAKQHVSAKASKILGLSVGTAPMSMTSQVSNKVNNVMGEFSRGTKRIFAHLTENEKLTIAMEQVMRKLDQEDAVVTKYHSLRLHGEDSVGYSAYSNPNSMYSLNDQSCKEHETKESSCERASPEAEEKYIRMNDGSRYAYPDAKNVDKDYKSDDTEATTPSHGSFAVKREFKDSI
jgi:hypothetical protein